MITFKENNGIKPYLTKIPLRAPERHLDLEIEVTFFFFFFGGGGLFKCYFRGSVFLYAAV